MSLPVRMEPGNRVYIEHCGCWRTSHRVVSSPRWRVKVVCSPHSGLGQKHYRGRCDKAIIRFRAQCENVLLAFALASQETSLGTRLTWVCLLPGCLLSVLIPKSSMNASGMGQRFAHQPYWSIETDRWSAFEALMANGRLLLTISPCLTA